MTDETRLGLLICRVCFECSCSKEDLMLPAEAHGSRLQPLVRARQVLYYTMREKFSWSFPAIGKALRRDHSTVIHGVRRVARRLDAGEQFTTDLVKRLLAETGAE